MERESERVLSRCVEYFIGFLVNSDAKLRSYKSWTLFFKKTNFTNQFQFVEFQGAKQGVKGVSKGELLEERTKNNKNSIRCQPHFKQIFIFLFQVLSELQNLPEKVSNQSVFIVFELQVK